MSRAKYLSSSPCGFWKKDFLSFYFMYIRKTNDPRGRANFDSKAKISTIFVEVHQTMFYVKYLSSSLYKLGGGDFLRFFFLLPWQPEFCMELNSLNIFETALCARNIHTKFYQIWPSGFGGEVILMKKFTDRQWTSRYSAQVS